MVLLSNNCAAELTWPCIKQNKMAAIPIIFTKKASMRQTMKSLDYYNYYNSKNINFLKTKSQKVWGKAVQK